MVEQGDLKIAETAEGSCYKLDPVTQFLDEVRDLAETHSQEDSRRNSGTSPTRSTAGSTNST
jgi:hypothetical protein